MQISRGGAGQVPRAGGAPQARWQADNSVSEIGDAENISKSCVSRILRLALLAPSILEQIVDGRADQSLMLERLERPLPADWEEQRQHLHHRPTIPCQQSAFYTWLETDARN